MSSCEDYMDKVLKILHTNVVWSNIFYLIAGIYALIKHQYAFGLIILLIGIISTIHHSNYNLFFSKNTWSKFDGILANILVIITFTYIAINQYKYFQNHNNFFVPYNIVIFISIFTLLFFLLGFFQKLNNPDYQDEDVGIVGPILAEEDPGLSCKNKSKQAISMVYHIIWHILSGITAILFVSNL